MNDMDHSTHQHEHDHSDHYSTTSSGSGDHTDHHKMMMEDFKRRFWVTLPLVIITLILSPQIQQWFGYSLDFLYRDIILFILGSVIVVYGGKPFYIAAKEELKSRNYGMMTLVSLAISAAYLFSVASTFFFTGKSFYWEVATLVSVFLFGHWMEMKAVVGTGGALNELSKLIPPMAHKLVGKKQKDVKTESLKKGDLVLVKPGEKIPIDGVVVEGTSSVNESMITGESKPIDKVKGNQVIGGTVNNDGALTVKVTKVGTETALSQVMDLIRKAQETKPPVQKLADRVANILTIAAIVVSVMTFIYWFYINPQGAVFAATLAITVVVITCPHALGLAIPTVTTVATSLAARSGILIRNMEGLEVARNIDYVVFDKTGTLTKGVFGISRIKIFDTKVKNKDLLKLAAAVEVNSEHSIAKSIVNEARKSKIEFASATNFKAYPGKGAVGIVGKSKVIVGNKTMMGKMGIGVSDGEGEAGTVVYVARGKESLGAIILEDMVRKESKKVVAKLHEMGIKVAMLTGDKREVASRVGKRLGIDTIYSEVLPEDKLEKVKELQKKGFRVAMVGDGVNDAPSLTQADVGIAIGAGTDVAIESAEIVLVKSNPLDVAKTIRLSRLTDTKMKQNLGWAAGYNLIAIPIAAGLLAPFGIFLQPQWAALAMSASSIIVVANALRLRTVKL